MGTASDRTAITVINAKTRKCHAIFKSSTIQYKETFRFLYTLINNYIPNSVLVIENNIDTLIEYVMNSSLRHILYYEFAKNTVKEKRKKGVKVYDQKNNILYGLTTTSSNRPKYFDILFELVRNEQDLINCKELVEEIEFLEYKSPTRIEAVSKQHDDVIISYLLGIYVLMYGNNKPRFGLLYADGLGTEYKEVSSSIFDSRNRTSIFDNNKKSNIETMLDNPFWAELLTMQNDNAEDMEYRWTKSKIKNKQDLLDFKSNIFSGEQDEYGISRAKYNAFYDLNVDRDDDLSPEDTFAVLNAYGGFNDFDDNDSFF